MPRIVCLIASATEIVYALGEIGNLVGRPHECDHPESVKSLPVCTAPRFVFDDVLERLRPTHILTQVQCDVRAVSPRHPGLFLPFLRNIGWRSL